MELFNFKSTKSISLHPVEAVYVVDSIIPLWCSPCHRMMWLQPQPGVSRSPVHGSGGSSGLYCTSELAPPTALLPQPVNTQ